MQPLRSAFFALALGARALTAQVPDRLSPAELGALSARLSEPGGFFDTDNLVSNEDSYLHAITTLQKLGVSNGAYLGVGPDQNYSYIAAVQPRIAFILDIRRDNLLEHLLFKSLFALARNRAEYLALLFGKPAPPDTNGWGGKDLKELLDYIDRAPSDAPGASAAGARVREGTSRFGIPLSAGDLETIGRFHSTFIAEGPSLRLTTFNRPERFDYPSYRRLLLETDLAGRRASYLASEEGFRVVQSLSRRNLIVPVVGDFAGEKALVAIGRYLSERGERVSVFYTSNVEQYLFQGGTFARFAGNVERLPHDSRSVIIRSYFPYGWSHPQAVTGYLSVQLVQAFDRLTAAQAAGGYGNYRDLVTRDIISPTDPNQRDR